MKISKEDREILRIIVKQVHLKHSPAQFCTDYEADKVIDVIAPATLERLKEVGKKFKINEV